MESLLNSSEGISLFEGDASLVSSYSNCSSVEGFDKNCSAVRPYLGIDRRHLFVIDITLSAPLIILLSVTNLWIIIAIALKRQLHSYSNYFLANLVFSELLYVFVSVPLESFVYGLIGQPCISCDDYMFFILILSSVYSGYFLCAVCFSVDKYIKISRPLKYATIVTGRICVIFIMVAWVSAMVFSSAMTVYSISNQECQTEAKNSFLDAMKLEFLIVNNTISLASIAVITALNVAIIRIARHQVRAVAQQAPDGNQPNSSKSMRYFGRFLWSFVFVWLPPIVISDCFHFIGSTDDQDWYLVTKMVMKILGLFQMLYGTIVLILLQEQFKDVLKSNWQFLRKKLHI